LCFSESQWERCFSGKRQITEQIEPQHRKNSVARNFDPDAPAGLPNPVETGSDLPIPTEQIEPQHQKKLHISVRKIYSLCIAV